MGAGRNPNLESRRSVVPVQGHAGLAEHVGDFAAANVGVKPGLAMGGIKEPQDDGPGLRPAVGAHGGQRGQVQRMAAGSGCGDQLARNQVPGLRWRGLRQIPVEERIGCDGGEVVGEPVHPRVFRLSFSGRSARH